MSYHDCGIIQSISRLIRQFLHPVCGIIHPHVIKSYGFFLIDSLSFIKQAMRIMPYAKLIYHFLHDGVLLIVNESEIKIRS